MSSTGDTLRCANNSTLETTGKIVADVKIDGI